MRAFHPHALWSHDFNMAITAPGVTSVLKVGKERKTAPAIYVFVSWQSHRKLLFASHWAEVTMCLLPAAREAGKVVSVFQALEEESNREQCDGKGCEISQHCVCTNPKWEKSFLGQGSNM